MAMEQTVLDEIVNVFVNRILALAEKRVEAMLAEKLSVQNAKIDEMLAAGILKSEGFREAVVSIVTNDPDVERLMTRQIEEEVREGVDEAIKDRDLVDSGEMERAIEKAGSDLKEEIERTTTDENEIESMIDDALDKRLDGEELESAVVKAMTDGEFSVTLKFESKN